MYVYSYMNSCMSIFVHMYMEMYKCTKRRVTRQRARYRSLAVRKPKELRTATVRVRASVPAQAFIDRVQYADDALSHSLGL